MQALMGVRSVVSVFSFAGVVVEVVSGYSAMQSKFIQFKVNQDSIKVIMLPDPVESVIQALSAFSFAGVVVEVVSGYTAVQSKLIQFKVN